ncbi:MAG: hypothetical protein JRE19_16530 [Deltaproteobacteria bacterium]|nr:hypothetical protein [Deltaproteobacteria bacterium]
MVERMGICEKHQLPLDRNGECELCRLSDMPSKVPPARSAWWALIIPLVLVAGGTAWARVRVAAPRPVSSPPPREEPRVPGPETVPEPPPVPGDDVPIPGPSPTSTRLDEGAPRGTPPTAANIPEWKWNIARRRVMITMYATQWCGVCRKAREYMQTNRIDFIELDTDESSVAGERLGELNPGRTIPTFQIDDQVYIGFQEDLFEAKINQAAQKHL